MICVLVERREDGIYKIDAEWMGYGNRDLIEAFEMEGVDFKKELDKIKVGEAKVWNIGYYFNDICHRKFLPSKVRKFGNNSENVKMKTQ